MFPTDKLQENYMNAAKSLIACLLVAAASLAPAAQATSIDFNHLVGTNPAGNSYSDSRLAQYNPGATLTNSGFRFVGDGYQYLIGTAYSGDNDGNSLAYNGTDYFMSSGTLTISSATASPFKVNSIDLAKWSDGSSTTQATLTGTKVGGTTVTQVIDLTTIAAFNSTKLAGNDFTSYALSGFDNLSSLTIGHNSYDYLAFDNLVINAAAVPEPSSIALFGLAIAGCAFMRRRIGKAS
jgi:hypothetical protein